MMIARLLLLPLLLRLLLLLLLLRAPRWRRRPKILAAANLRKRDHTWRTSAYWRYPCLHLQRNGRNCGNLRTLPAGEHLGNTWVRGGR